MGSTRGRESVSFVIIAFNEEANIARAIFAITGLEGLGDHEIIVVDDGSRDGTARVVRDIGRRDPAVRLINTGDNRGRGYARSTGVAAARGALIATVDADVILPPDWLTRARQALCGRDAVGGIAVPDGDVTYLRKRFGLAPRVVHGTTTVTGNNGLYRRGVFDVIGFDPALREGEDSALNHAMRRHGLSAATVPGLLVQHEGNKTLVASLRWLFEVGQGATRQLLTYGEIRQPDIVTGAFVGATALGLAVAARKHRLAGAAIPAGFVLAASIQHVRSRFETPRAQLRQVVPAVGVDSAMLTAYFAGRLAGLCALRRPALTPAAPRRPPPSAPAPPAPGASRRNSVA
jgi:Glycosyl transferase family 2